MNMKKFILSLILTIFAVSLYAQSSGKNFIKETVYRTQSTRLIAPQANNFENIIYLDKLGRPEQLIEQNASPVDQQNIVKHIEYNDYTGQTKDFLPFTVQGKTTTNFGGKYLTTYNGNFINNANAETLNYYNTEENEFTQNPFSEIKIKNNLSREVEEIASPGFDWAMDNGHTVKVDVGANIASEVKLFKANASWNSTTKSYTNTLTQSGYFTANDLKKQVIKNENWKTSDGKNNTTEVFKGIDGRIHLKRTYNQSVAHDTYYVYNQLSQLTYVLTPEATDGTITAAVLNELCFQYNYDANGMLAEKKVPGKKWEYFVYDKAGRIAFSGPNLNPFGTGTEGWMFVKYDYMNRPVYRGFYTGHGVNGASRATLENTLKSQTVHHEKRQSNTVTVDGVAISYTNQVYPTTAVNLLEINYYDSYAFANGPTTIENVNGAAPNINVKGLLTGVWVRTITTSAEQKGDITYLAYDNKYRPIRVNTNNAQGGLTQVNSKYNFFGNPTEVQTVHKKTNSATAVTTVEKFTYNNREYLLKHTHSVNGGTEELMASYEYDALGKLKRKSVGNNAASPLQKIDYKYNVRGWLTQINNPNNLNENSDNDLFGLKINYNTTENLPSAVKKQYNGNISSVEWKTRTDDIKRGYAYYYDGLNRLSEASMFQNNVISNDFREMADYSKNGNITSMYRTSGNINGQVVEIDDAIYNYSPKSNKLLSVSDVTNHSEGINDVNKTGDDYVYDTYGNLVADKNRNITKISYNHVNQPVQMIFANGDNIIFTYNSYGSRIKKTVTQNGSTNVVEYLDGYEYKNNQLKYIATTEGFIKFENNAYNYVYQYKDQIGNVRLTYQDINKNGVVENTEILNESNYYPFGLKHGHYNQLANNFSNSLLPNAGFNGQPSLVDLDANLSLMDFRLYDGALGRFLGIDLLADMFTDHSPYHFGYNNPIAFADPTGLYSNPHPGNSIVIGDNGDIAIYFTNADGDMEAIFFVNRKSGAESQEIKQLGQDPHQYGGGGGGGSNSGSGSAGGGGGSGSGSGNSGPREASNGFSPSEISTLATVGSVFANGLEGRANENVNHKYKYGSNTHTAKELTDLNKARMNNIAKGANVLGRAVGVTGAAIAVYDAFENPTTANIIKASANVGLLFVRMNPVTGVILGISDLSGFSDFIYNGVGNIIDNY